MSEDLVIVGFLYIVSDMNFTRMQRKFVVVLDCVAVDVVCT